MAKEKFKLNSAVLKKAGKELTEILEPTDDEGNSIKIYLGKSKEMKEKIKEAGACLTTEDAISDNLTNVLKELGIVVTDEENTNSKENEGEDIKKEELTWDTISVMGKKELQNLCEEKDLLTDSDDYDELMDYRKEVAIELDIEVPDDENDTMEENKEKIQEIDLLELVNGTKKLADLKSIVEDNDEFKKLKKGLKKYAGLSGPRKLKPKMLKILGIDVDTKKEVSKDKLKKENKNKSETKRKEVQKEGKTEKKKITKYNRVTSVSDIIAKLGKKGFTIKEVQNESDKLYVDKTGNTKFDSSVKKMHPATHIVNYMVTGLVIFNILEKTDKIYKFVK